MDDLCRPRFRGFRVVGDGFSVHAPGADPGLKAGRIASPRRPRFAMCGFGAAVRSEIGPYQAVT
jgi:hypothetical protein